MASDPDMAAQDGISPRPQVARQPNHNRPSLSTLKSVVVTFFMMLKHCCFFCSLCLLLVHIDLRITVALAAGSQAVQATGTPPGILCPPVPHGMEAGGPLGDFPNKCFMAWWLAALWMTFAPHYFFNLKNKMIKLVSSGACL